MGLFKRYGLWPNVDVHTSYTSLIILIVVVPAFFLNSVTKCV